MNVAFWSGMGSPWRQSVMKSAWRQSVLFLASSAWPILIEHNNENFDVPILIHNLQRVNRVKSSRLIFLGLLTLINHPKKRCLIRHATVTNNKEKTLVTIWLVVECRVWCYQFEEVSRNVWCYWFFYFSILLCKVVTWTSSMQESNFISQMQGTCFIFT